MGQLLSCVRQNEDDVLGMEELDLRTRKASITPIPPLTVLQSTKRRKTS